MELLDLHTEWEMSFEYAAFEGYGIEDAQSETELDSADSHEDQPWWICLIPHFLRWAEYSPSWLVTLHLTLIIFLACYSY